MCFGHDKLLHLYFNRNEKDLEIGIHLWVLSLVDWDCQTDFGFFTRVCVRVSCIPRGYYDLLVINPSDSQRELHQIVFRDQESAEQIEILLHCVLFNNRILECLDANIVGVRSNPSKMWLRCLL